MSFILAGAYTKLRRSRTKRYAFEVPRGSFRLNSKSDGDEDEEVIPEPIYNPVIKTRSELFNSVSLPKEYDSSTKDRKQLDATLDIDEFNNIFHDLVDLPEGLERSFPSEMRRIREDSQNGNDFLEAKEEGEDEEEIMEIVDTFAFKISKKDLEKAIRRKAELSGSVEPSRDNTSDSSMSTGNNENDIAQRLLVDDSFLDKLDLSFDDVQMRDGKRVLQVEMEMDELTDILNAGGSIDITDTDPLQVGAMNQFADVSVDSLVYRPDADTFEVDSEQIKQQIQANRKHRRSSRGGIAYDSRMMREAVAVLNSDKASAMTRNCTAVSSRSSTMAQNSSSSSESFGKGSMLTVVGTKSGDILGAFCGSLVVVLVTMLVLTGFNGLSIKIVNSLKTLSKHSSKRVSKVSSSHLNFASPQEGGNIALLSLIFLGRIAKSGYQTVRLHLDKAAIPYLFLLCLLSYVGHHILGWWREERRFRGIGFKEKNPSIAQRIFPHPDF